VHFLRSLFRRKPSKLDLILWEVHRMSAELNVLIAAVEAENTVIESAIVLLNELSALILAAKDDPAALAALAAEVSQKASALAEAVTANTPPPPAA
jgi:hypothetical protein